MEEPRWTLDELAERVDAALAVDYAGQPSGRVRDVPDRRAIRWYTTIGLVDRPLAHRGRTALYGPRHLLQLVAVKRLQARGLPLVAIQRELAGATDAQLAGVARLPATAPAAPPRAAAAAAAAEPGPATDPGPATEPGVAAEHGAAVAARLAGPRSRRPAAFWRERPTAETPAAPTPPGAPEASGTPGLPGPGGGDGVATLRGVRLGEGATLLLEPRRELEAGDLAAVLEAARPLLAVLAARGLAGPPADPVPRPPATPGPRREPR
jgi:hypothetical protein